jgi:hypothetical protein
MRLISKYYFWIVCAVRPPLWSSDQSSWLQIRRALQEKKKVVGLERGPLSLVSTTEELLGRNSSGSGLESREYGRRHSSRWPRSTLYPQKKLALTSLTSGGRSVRIARLRTEATKFLLGAVHVIIKNLIGLFSVMFFCLCASSFGLHSPSIYLK